MEEVSELLQKIRKGFFKNSTENDNMLKDDIVAYLIGSPAEVGLGPEIGGQVHVRRGNSVEGGLGEVTESTGGTV